MTPLEIELLAALKAMVKNFWHGYDTESEREMFRANYPNSVVVKAEQVIKKATE